VAFSPSVIEALALQGLMKWSTSGKIMHKTWKLICRRGDKVKEIDEYIAP